MFYLTESDKRVVESFDKLHMKDGKSAILFCFYFLFFFLRNYLFFFSLFVVPQGKKEIQVYIKGRESNFYFKTKIINYLKASESAKTNFKFA